MSSRDVSKYALLVGVNSAIAGAIGAASASGSHPVLKGALYSGVVGGIIALAHVALTEDPNAPKQVGTSGHLRFP